MAGQADGSIIVDTQLDSEGFKAGSAELKGAIKSLSKEMSNLGPMFKEAMSGSGGAVSSFKTETENLENTISELESKLQDLGGAQIPTKEYASVCAEIDKINGKMSQLTAKKEKMLALRVDRDSTAYKSLLYDLNKLKEEYNEVSRAKAEMEANGTSHIEGVNTAEYAQLEAALLSARQQLAGMRSDVEDANRELEQVPAHGNFIKSAFRGIARLLGSMVKNAAKFVFTIGKFSVKSLVSGIRLAASSMAKMVKHGKSMNGQFGGLISGAKKFALSLLGARGVYALLRKAVSAYMSENQQLSNTLSACWSGIGNALGPIISKLINLVATAVAYVTQFLNLLGLVGKSTTKAIGSAGGAASKETDKLKRQLASFDELNILSDNSSDSGGGGGSTDTGSLPDVTLPDWAKLMVDQLKSGQWAEAAKTMTGQLNAMIASVDWAGAGEKIAYYLDGALTFLATAITTFDWYGLGANLGEAINSIIHNVDWGNLGIVLGAKFIALFGLLGGLFATIDWVGLGKALADGFMGLWNSIDWAQAAKMLSDGIIGALNGLASAIANVDWAMIGRKVADFLNGIDWSGIFSGLVKLLGSLLIGALNLLVGFVEQVDWTGLADEIWACLESLTNDIDWDNFGTLLGKGISGAVIGVLDLIGSLFGEHDWGAMIQDLVGSLGDALGAVIENIDWMGLLESLSVALASIITQIPGIIAGLLGGISDLIASLFEAVGLDSVAGFLSGIGDAMRSAGTWLKENLVDPVVNGVKNLFGIHSPSTVFAEIGTYLIGGLLQGITEGWDSITEFFSTAVSNLTEWLSSGWESIKTDASTAWSNIKTSVTGAWENIKSGASTGYEAVRSGVSSAWSSVKSGTSTVWSNVKSTVTSAWDSVKSKTSQVGSSVASSTSTAFTKAKNYVTDKMADARKNAEKSWDEIKSNTLSIGADIASNVNSSWNKIQSYVKTSLATTKSNNASTWNAMKTAVNSAASNMSSAVSSKFSSIYSTISSKVNSAKSAITSGFESARSAMVSKMTSAMNTIKGQGWYSVGTGICSGIQSGLNAGWSWLSNTVSNLARRLLSSAKSALGIHSPSRVFRDAVGLNIGYGIGEGIERSEGSVLGSVTSVADAIAEEFNAGDYEAANIIPTTEVNGAITTFSDTITEGLRSLLDKLQAIAENVSFAVPVSATSLIPYSTASRAQGESDTTSGLSGLSMDKLMDLLVQLLTNQTTAIVTAIQNYSGTQVNIDKDSLTTAVIEEINRRTRMAGASPLLT